MLEELGSKIHYLTSDGTKDWRKLLELSASLEPKEQRQFCWVWPTEENLKEFENILNGLQIVRVLSIGCGNGLLEWILKESIDLQVFGLEVDRVWWESQYAVKSFIELEYFDDLTLTHSQSAGLLQHSCRTDDWNFALLFCYFNNHEAFLNYLSLYKGHWIILIGPAPSVGIHTDPSPLEPNFPEDGPEWRLRQKITIRSSDLLVIYEKIVQ